MNRILLAFAFCCSTFIVHAQTDEMIIRTAMIRQVVSWNAGDINGFMEPYWKSDSLVFIGKSGITYGWEQTKLNYIKGYPDTTAMGQLTFDIIQVKRLSVLYFSVIGKWQLKRSIGNLEGHFTLLFKKIKDKWVIVSDHSS
jgi:hypothetical protein